MQKNIDFREEKRDTKTSYWVVFNVNERVDIGHVKWFGRWRQYAFFPDSGCIFEKNCLRAIADLCEEQSKAIRQTWNKK